MGLKKISIVIPVYNERRTVSEILKRVTKSDTLGLKKEIIIVDDGSTDGTSDILDRIVNKNIIKIFFEKNKGKGYALRKGFEEVTGDIVLIQDSDLEYHPKDYPKLIRPFIDGEARVVYGSRELSGKNKHSSILFHAGGKLITLITNMLYGSSLTDEATGYKIFETKLLKKLPLTCQRFEFCPEVTGHLLKNGIEIKEVPISYFRRYHNEGKKIKAIDGIEAIWTLIKVKFGQ